MGFEQFESVSPAEVSPTEKFGNLESHPNPEQKIYDSIFQNNPKMEIAFRHALRLQYPDRRTNEKYSPQSKSDLAQFIIEEFNSPEKYYSLLVSREGVRRRRNYEELSNPKISQERQRMLMEKSKYKHCHVFPEFN